MVEDHACLQGAEAARAHSSAYVMTIGNLAPPPAELAACACAVKMLNGEWTRQCCRPVAVHAGTTSSAAERRWCRIRRARSGRVSTDDENRCVHIARGECPRFVVSWCGVDAASSERREGLVIRPRGGREGGQPRAATGGSRKWGSPLRGEPHPLTGRGVVPAGSLSPRYRSGHGGGGTGLHFPTGRPPINR